MNVLAVDPGKATGLAGMYDGEFWSTILPWQEAMCYIVDNVSSVQLLVCEDYRISRNTLTKGADAHWPMGGIGICGWAATKENVECIKYSPSEAKSFATDAKLKRVGWFKTGAGHDNDAARHLMLALVNAGVFDLRKLMV